MLHDRLSDAAQLSATQRALVLEAAQVAESFLRGGHPRRRPGDGDAFWRFRPYAEGDARRDIDWKQTARRGDVFVREREREAAQELWLWRDATPSMEISSRRDCPTKRARAETLLLALGFLATEGGERIALLGAGAAPAAGPGTLERMSGLLADQQTLSEHRPVSPDAQAVFFSDFFFPVEDMSAFCGALARRPVRGILAQVCDPAEEALPSIGRARFINPEDGRDVLDLADTGSLSAAYAARLAAHRAAWADAARGWGWDMVILSTADPAHDNLATLVSRLEAR